MALPAILEYLTSELGPLLLVLFSCHYYLCQKSGFRWHALRDSHSRGACGPRERRDVPARSPLTRQPLGDDAVGGSIRTIPKTKRPPLLG